MLKPGHMAWCLLILVIRRVRDWIWWNLSYQTCTVQFARKISVVTPCGSPRYLRPVFIPCALNEWIKNDNIRESYLRTLLQNVTPFKVMRVMYYCRQKKTARLHWQINRKHRIRGKPGSTQPLHKVAANKVWNKSLLNAVSITCWNVKGNDYIGAQSSMKVTWQTENTVPMGRVEDELRSHSKHSNPAYAHGECPVVSSTPRSRTNAGLVWNRIYCYGSFPCVSRFLETLSS